MTTATTPQAGAQAEPAQVPFVSVVVPTHNRAAQLEDALAALWRQTYPADRYEVIVIDDGSQDDTPAVIQRMTPLAPCKVITHRTHGVGAAAARNLGMRLASGDILAHTDDDCRVPPDWIAAGVGAFRDNVAIVFGPIYPKPEQQVSFFSWIQVQDRPTGTYPTSNIFYRGDAARAAGFFDESFGGNLLGRPRWGWDNDFAYRLLRQGYAAHFEERAVAYTDVVRLSPLDWLKAGWRHSMIPATVRATPELRRHLLRFRLFNDGVSWSFELGLLATVAAVLHSRWWLLSWLPWLRFAAGTARHDWWPPLRWGALGAKIVLTFLLHAVRLAALMYGSVKARTPVL